MSSRLSGVVLLTPVINPARKMPVNNAHVGRITTYPI